MQNMSFGIYCKRYEGEYTVYSLMTAVLTQADTNFSNNSHLTYNYRTVYYKPLKILNIQIQF